MMIASADAISSERDRHRRIRREVGQRHIAVDVACATILVPPLLLKAKDLGGLVLDDITVGERVQLLRAALARTDEQQVAHDSDHGDAHHHQGDLVVSSTTVGGLRLPLGDLVFVDVLPLGRGHVGGGGGGLGGGGVERAVRILPRFA